MEWLSQKTSIAGIEISNWALVLAALIMYRVFTRCPSKQATHTIAASVAITTKVRSPLDMANLTATVRLH
jgi:hypothetical protein